MNRIFILSLLAIMLLQTFSKVLVIVDYQANKEYIMEFLCINSDKPELECEGKCYLTKELKKQEHTDKNAGEQKLAEVQINLFCQSMFTFQPIAVTTERSVLAKLTTGHTPQAFHSIFHPPQSIV